MIASLVQQWRDTGPVLWAGAGAAGLIWLILLGVLAASSEPRKVDAGSPTLDHAGPESPAVVNLITNDWELGHEAVPATLLDLAARRFVTIDWIGERTLVRVRQHGPEDRQLNDYEKLVLEHLRSLSKQTADGFVPADALTTGPDATAKNWWRRFDKAVCNDARAQGLSRPRWGAHARTALTAAAIAVGVAVGIAATTLTSSKKNDDPVGAAIGLAILSAGVLIAIVSKLGGERDTLDGRSHAARWLGLRTMLSDDPTFSTQPPAAVVTWDRTMAYGAAMGVARSAVAALPLGAESEHEAWSPVGDRWRVVRIRYPDRVPPGYGRHPGLVTFLGLVLTAVGIAVAPGAISVAHRLLRAIEDAATDHTVPAGVRAVIGVVAAAVVTAGALVAVWGGSMLIGGASDLVRGRRTVVGRVLRVRTRGDDKHRYWHVAVDDGTAARIRAWRVGTSPSVHQGETATARVTPWLHHVTGLAPVHPEGEPPAAPDPAAGALAAVPPGAPAALAPPPLPTAETIAGAVGMPVRLEVGAAHPLALDGASAIYQTPDGGRIFVAWVRPEMFESFRRMPKLLATPVTGIGEEAYRSRMGGGLIARVDGHVLTVGSSLPSLSGDRRDQTTEAIARAVAAQLDAQDHPADSR